MAISSPDRLRLPGRVLVLRHAAARADWACRDLPAADLMTAVRAFADAKQLGLDRFRLAPTLVMARGCGDGFLLVSASPWGRARSAACRRISLLSGSAAVSGPLSVARQSSHRGIPGYQWDALPRKPASWPSFWRRCSAATRSRFRRSRPEPRPLARWLLWWLLFRLMFGSGLVKLASGDPTWRGLTALAVHYETQPLPTPIARGTRTSCHSGFRKRPTAVVLVIELSAPWLISVLRRPAAWPRAAPCWAGRRY